MKYIIGLIVLLTIISCERPKVTHLKEEESLNLRYYSVKIIDNCEYIIYEEGIADFATYGITHKGNCKNHTRTSYTK